jgi:tetraacyldisaccharide 4'-kinase
MMSFDKIFHRTLAEDRPPILAPLSALLRLASWFYGLGHGFRLRAYRCGWWRAERLNCRVISVGNLTLGGTGKTPMVVKIARILKDRGLGPAVLSRGYGGGSRSAVNVVSDGREVLLAASEAGDEPVMIARKLGDVPVLTGRDRRRTGRYAIDRLGADILILDDGFQHLALARDLNILLLDWQRPFGNRRPFPAGELRDPISETARADLICFTRCPQGQKAAQAELPAGVPVVHAAYRSQSLLPLGGGEALAPESLKGERVAAFAGIARPVDFLQQVEAIGAEVVHFQAFPDHHAYTGEECEAFARAAGSRGAKFILVSEKDSVKLSAGSFSLPVFALAVEMEFLEGDPLLTRYLLGPLASREEKPVA